MRLRHVTPVVNQDSIMKDGLDPEYAVTESDAKYVWLHTPRNTPWALAYTSRRKKVLKEEIITLEVTVPRSWLTRAWPGVWKCPRVIPPERIKEW